MTTRLAPVRSVVIVGFGMIGASVAMAVRARDPSVHLVAVDQLHVVNLTDVQARVDLALDASSSAEVTAQFAAAELVLLAAPVGVIEHQLPGALAHANCVTDCGSTKRRLVAAAQRCPTPERFVPGHPMAGASRSGSSAANPDLFVGRRWLLCPGVADAERFERVRQFVRFLGAEVEELTPEAHDRAVALTSHLPQLLASLLEVLGDERHARVAAGPGFASATRVAGGNVTIWRDIFESNADQIAAASSELAERLHRLSADFARGDVFSALELLDAASRVKSGKKVAD